MQEANKGLWKRRSTIRAIQLMGLHWNQEKMVSLLPYSLMPTQPRKEYVLNAVWYPIPSTYPSEGALLQTLPVRNFSVQKWPFKGLAIFHIWVEEGKNKTKNPWPLKNRLVKFKGQFSWNGVLNCSVLSVEQGPRLLSCTHFAFINFLIPISLSSLGGRRAGFTCSGTDPPLPWRQNGGCPRARWLPGLLPGHWAPGIAAHTRSFWAAFSSTSTPSGTWDALCHPGVCRALPQAPLSAGGRWGWQPAPQPGDWALARLPAQALSKSHS